VSQLLELRTAHGISTQPLLVWEPAPASCDLANQAAHVTAASLVDVYSPNHIEFLATFEHNSDDILRPSPPHLDRERIQAYALRLLDLGVGTHGKGAVVIRCGEHGSLVVSRRYPARWFPAFYNATSAKVVDATGAGNAFLGAFTITLGEMADLTEAAIAGCVAASFAIEQIGLPRSTEQDGKEAWNAVQFSARVREYRAMLEA
jgi:sugar/nucleoside kinase (ribokinase family)